VIRIRRAILLIPFLTGASLSALPAASVSIDDSGWRFTDVTASAGIHAVHGYAGGAQVDQARLTAAGVAAGDYDDDGWIDLYFVSGDHSGNQLLRNLGNGRFENRSEAAGVGLRGQSGAGPIFADIDGDDRLDLLVLGVRAPFVTLFRNRGDGRFEDVTSRSHLPLDRDSYSAAFGDYDGDGDLDLFVTHWATFGAAGTTQHLWRNDGDWQFTDVSLTSDISRAFFDPDEIVFQDFSFTPTFADLDSDGWPDLVVAGDFGTSKLFRNRRDGTFENITSAVISDENGMGSAVGDYDNDGDLDWFVSSVWDPNGKAEAFWGISGNRLYRNRGDGRFDDATDLAGVREGYWGWASTFADLNNDGHLDLFHVNGWGPLQDAAAAEFHFDPSRCFIGRGDGSFAEMATELGLDDHGQGRGVVAFDYDRDGDIDLFIANNQQPALLLRNDGGNRRSYLDVALRGSPSNREAIGARIYVTAGGITQMRELRAGNNFVSQDPVEAHFGLAKAHVVEEIRVIWPNGTIPPLVLRQVPANQRLVLHQALCAGDCNADGRVTVEEIEALIEHIFSSGQAQPCGVSLRTTVRAPDLVAAVRAATGISVGCQNTS
jgi:hypothetical protein